MATCTDPNNISHAKWWSTEVESRKGCWPEKLICPVPLTNLFCRHCQKNVHFHSGTSGLRWYCLTPFFNQVVVNRNSLVCSNLENWFKNGKRPKPTQYRWLNLYALAIYSNIFMKKFLVNPPTLLSPSD